MSAFEVHGAPPATDFFTRLQSDAGRLPMPVRGFLNELASGAVNSVGSSSRKALVTQTGDGIGNVCRQMITARYPFERGASRNMPPDEFKRLFASGGLFDDYFQKTLAAEVDTSGVRWRFRPLPVADTGAGTGGTTDASRDSRVLDTFRAAAKIRDTYFGSNERTPAFDIALTPLETDPEILQYTLTVGGQTLRYAHGPATPQVIKWSADASQRATLEINTASGQQTLQGDGPWALQRLFDKAQMAAGDSADNQNATFSIGGRKLSLRVGAGTGGGDPLHRAELLAFRCPA